jgi:hypothetical protein
LSLCPQTSIEFCALLHSPGCAVLLTDKKPFPKTQAINVKSSPFDGLIYDPHRNSNPASRAESLPTRHQSGWQPDCHMKRVADEVGHAICKQSNPGRAGSAVPISALPLASGDLDANRCKMLAPDTACKSFMPEAPNPPFDFTNKRPGGSL